MFLSDGIPIIYSGQEQHYSGGADPANREATWLSGYSTTAELYKYIATTNKIRKLAVSDSSYLTTKVGTHTTYPLVDANASLERTILPRQPYTSYEEGIQCLTSNHSAIKLWIIWKLLHIVIEWKRIFIRHQAHGDVHLHIGDS